MVCFIYSTRLRKLERAEVLDLFKKLKVEEQHKIIESINTVATANQKVEKIIKVIAKLEQQK
jgi:predicted HAD superfamily phosphohydrolase